MDKDRINRGICEERGEFMEVVEAKLRLPMRKSDKDNICINQSGDGPIKIVMTPSKFIGKAFYDQLGQMIWGNTKKGDQLILDLRGWGAIQNLFKSQVEAATFQDELGQFVVDAINEKIERDAPSRKRIRPTGPPPKPKRKVFDPPSRKFTTTKGPNQQFAEAMEQISDSIEYKMAMQKLPEIAKEYFTGRRSDNPLP